MQFLLNNRSLNRNRLLSTNSPKFGQLKVFSDPQRIITGRLTRGRETWYLNNKKGQRCAPPRYTQKLPCSYSSSRKLFRISRIKYPGIIMPWWSAMCIFASRIYTYLHLFIYLYFIYKYTFVCIQCTTHVS